MRFTPGIDFPDVVLSVSLNGLIYLEDKYHDSAYVCNPITQEYILLQNSEYTKKSYVKGYNGFRNVESNNQYKIVRFYKGSFPSSESSHYLGSKVYSLGTVMWRYLGLIPFHLNGYDSSMYASGNLHWLADEVIWTFDLDKNIISSNGSSSSG